MTCPECTPVPQPSLNKNYLLYLFDTDQMRLGWCVVQSPCPHGMQDFITSLANKGGLVVNDHDGNKFTMYHPQVLKVDDKTAAHLPLVDPAAS